MKILIVSQSEVTELLPMDECIDLMADTLKVLGQGEVLNPLRRGMLLPERSGILAMMPAYMGNIPAMGLKAISVLPGNEATEYDSHLGAVLLFETEHGRLKAVIDATSITAIRTAAVSGVATRLLAREDAGDLAILGSAAQANTHLQAMLLVRKIRRVRVWSRTYEKALAFSERESKRHSIEVEIAQTPFEAVRGADIICTTTAAREPVVMGEWITPGAHINAVGSSIPFARELDTPAVKASRVFVDSRESALNEAGDLLIPMEESAIGEEHIVGEIGEILLGKISGRRSADEITLFKSLGLAVEDIASADYIFKKAVERGAGTWVDFGGLRHIF
jgi:ornithine cyclodeaminase/alanine dehydrogenase-like protein (mu-crystallin family)